MRSNSQSLKNKKGRNSMDKGKLVSFRVTNDLAEELEKLRRQKFINVSELTRNLLTEYLENSLSNDRKVKQNG